MVNLMENLQKTFESLDDSVARNSVISLELEHGPFFTLQDFDGLKKLVDLIDAFGLSGAVGLYLDIAHWRMARIRPEQIINCERVFENICHSHIAGHCERAHSGDLPPFGLTPDSHEREQIIPWLKLLEQRAGEQTAIPYSGFVSLEMEAANSLLLQEGISQLSAL